MGSGGDSVLNRFQLSLLTEGSGTQVFATTFVQWAARETLRRAQPLTLFARFTPRQRENPMNELLAETQRRPELDPQGSLVDADMGAYYTWLNQQRLPGASRPPFSPGSRTTRKPWPLVRDSNRTNFGCANRIEGTGRPTGLDLLRRKVPVDVQDHVRLVSYVNVNRIVLSQPEQSRRWRG